MPRTLSKQPATLSRRQLLGLPLASLATALGPLSARASAWPAKPVRLVIPVPAGGATDYAARAVGGGLALSLACDWRVLAEDAFVSLPEIALGIPLTWGTIARLVNLLGPAKAKRLTILCERISAQESLAMGLVDYVSDKGQALARAQALAAQTLAMPAATMRMSKESVNAAATALNHATSYMAHDQIALAASSPESRAARDQALG